MYTQKRNVKSARFFFILHFKPVTVTYSNIKTRQDGNQSVNMVTSRTLASRLHAPGCTPHAIGKLS